jgi:hypothetical protein
MKGKKSIQLLIVASISCFMASVVSAQVDPNSTGYYQYVPTFGGQTVYGSARMQGLAGAGVSLGGDIGQISLNPASLGVFRKSEFSLSAGIGVNTTQSDFLNNTTPSSRTWFGLPNFGAVFNFSKDDIVPGIFRGGSLGITFTKTNNYQQQFQLSGINGHNSMTDYFVQNANAGLASGRTFSDVQNELANNSLPSSLDALAYGSFLIDYDGSQYYAGIGYDSTSSTDGTTTHYSRPDYYDFSVHKAKQQETNIQKGGQYAWDMSYGANINDRVYLGIGASMLISNYQTQRSFTETHLPTYGLKDFTFTESDIHKGTGFNAKVGIIVKATDWLRIGGSVHSPTYNYMRETYNWSLSGNFDNVVINATPSGGDNGILSHSDIKSTTNLFNYRYVKPMRATAGITLLAGKIGFLTADVEYVPYKTSSLHYPGNQFYFSGDNNTIQSIYANVFNYRLGAELKVAKNYRVRGGMAYYADPYNHNSPSVGDLKRDAYNFTLGGGYRIEGFYVDLAIVENVSNQIYKPYTLNNGTEPTATIKSHYGFYQVTVGFTF